MKDIVLISKNEFTEIFNIIGIKNILINASNFDYQILNNYKIIIYDYEIRNEILKFKNEKNNDDQIFLEISLKEENIGLSFIELLNNIEKSIGLTIS